MGYVAHDGILIWGTGKTAVEAEANARGIENLLVEPATPALVDWVINHGRNVAYRRLSNGTLCTYNEQQDETDALVGWP